MESSSFVSCTFEGTIRHMQRHSAKELLNRLSKVVGFELKLYWRSDYAFEIFGHKKFPVRERIQCSCKLAEYKFYVLPFDDVQIRLKNDLGRIKLDASAKEDLAYKQMLARMLYAAQYSDVRIDSAGWLCDSTDTMYANFWKDLKNPTVVLERGTCTLDALEIWLDLNERHDDDESY